MEGRRGYQRPLHGGYVSQPVTTPEEMMCSFCGGNTHDYRDCPTMHQYIREQADALAQRRMGECQQPREWGGYEIPRQVPSYQGPYFRGGGPDEGGPKSGRGPSKKETQKQKIPTKSGETRAADPRSMGGMAPGGGERLHHQVGEVLQMIEEMMNQMRRKMRRMTLMKKLYR